MTVFERIRIGRLEGFVDSRFSKGLREHLGDDPGVADLLAKSRRSDTAGRSATHLLCLRGHAEDLHLRTVRRGGWLGALLPNRFAGSDRSRRELERSERLLAAGVPVARGAFAVGERRGPFWLGVVATVHVPESCNGIDWLRAKPEAEAVRRVAQRLGVALRDLHDQRVAHGDLHLGNVLVGASGEVRLIDLDAASAAEPNARMRMRDIMRLERSAAKHGLREAIDVRARADFLDAYCRGDEALRSELLARLGSERLRIALHGFALRRRLQPRPDEGH